MVFPSIQARFAAQVARVADAVAVSSGEVRLTYRELDERANRLAHRLVALGAGRDVPVAVLMERSINVVVAFLAALKAGAIYLPLHSAYPLDRMRWIVDTARVPILLADEVMRRRGLPHSDQTIIVDTDARLAELPVSAPHLDTNNDTDATAFVIYTSGSTGQPKGVAVTHRGVLDFVADSCWDTGRHDRLLMVAPHAFSVSTYEVWVPLLHGGQIVVAPPGQLEVSTLRRLIAEEKITGLHLTAGLFRVLVEEAPDCLAGVREVLTGGDVIAPTAVRRALEACPDIVVRAMYGATETTLFVTTSPMSFLYQQEATVPVGRPMDNVRAYVLDEGLRPVAVGTTGELYVGGGRLARGYFERADLTAERFVANPFRAGERMYRTGDLVRWTAEGLIDFVGRAGDQVKIRGFRVELAEVESALAKHPGVAHVAVAAHELEPGDQRLAAYIVAKAGAVEVADLRAFITDVLPDYMVPAAFVMMDALPLTPNGKLDRRGLPKPEFQWVSTYRAPYNSRQVALCGIFAAVLGVPIVGIDDSFFDLDGQSLLAMRLINRVKSELGAELSIGDLFNAPTVADLDSLLEIGADQTADTTPEGAR
jgi:amino acid adenylation domain-containing protein